jgi:tetratricopeptide (TPR) repeat protein
MTIDLDQFNRIMNQGHSAAWDQNWEQAAKFYREALKISEDSPQALTSLGLALIELGEHQEALQCYQRCAQIEPDNPLPFEKIGQLCELKNNTKLAGRAYLRAADLHIKEKNAHKAVENWERIIQFDPNNLTANMRLGIIYEKLGEKIKAVQALLAAASGYQSSGNPEKARQTIEQALKIMPNNQDAARFLSLLADYKPLPRETAARETPVPAVPRRELQNNSSKESQPEIDPIQEAAVRAVAVLADLVFESESQRVFQSKRKDLQTLLAGASDKIQQLPDLSGVRQHIIQSIDFQKKGAFDEAAGELQKAVDIGLDHPAAFFNLGFLHKQAGNLEKATQNLQRAVKNDEFAFGGHLLFGDLLRENDQIPEASLEYTLALELADIQTSSEDQSQRLQQWYELLIETSIQKQDPALQKRICENIPKILNRPDWRISLQRVRMQMSGARNSGALIPVGEMISQVESSEVIESIAAINDLSNRGLYHSAMEEALYALQHAPTYLPLHALIGDLLEITGDHEGAVAKFHAISRTYEIRGEMAQSIAHARRVVELSPGDLDEREKLVDQLFAAGQVNDAIEELSQLAGFHYALADLESARKSYMRAYNAALRAGGELQLKVRLLQQMTDIDLQSMEWRRAIDTFEQIRLIQPELQSARDQIIRLNLRLRQETQALAELDHYANFLTGNQRSYELARFIEDLLNDYPGKIPLKRRLVDVYRINGQTSEAVMQLDSIRETLMQTGDLSGAIQTIETIISLAPPNRAEYQILLEQLRSKIQL